MWVRVPASHYPLFFMKMPEFNQCPTAVWEGSEYNHPQAIAEEASKRSFMTLCFKNEEDYIWLKMKFDGTSGFSFSNTYEDIQPLRINASDILARIRAKGQSAGSILPNNIKIKK